MLLSGSVRILYISFAPSPLSSTRIGSRPFVSSLMEGSKSKEGKGQTPKLVATLHTCSSANMSAGFDLWKAPEHMKSTWSVETLPYFVDTTLPERAPEGVEWPLTLCLATHPHPHSTRSPSPSTHSPSMMGNRSLWTPSLLTLPPTRPPRPSTILSISSIKTMPSCEARITCYGHRQQAKHVNDNPHLSHNT